MPLGKRGWLEPLVREAVAGHRPDVDSRSAKEAMALPPGPARARRYLRGIFRETGLLYGTPQGASADAEAGKEAALFLAILRTFCRIGLDVAVHADTPPGPRPEQLLMLFSALIDRLDDAEAVHGRLLHPVREAVTPAGGVQAMLRGMNTAFGRSRGAKAPKPTPGLVPQALWLSLEEALSERAPSLSADPYYGLVLHNGAVYADAHLFGRLALATFSRTDFPREMMTRRLRFAAMQKALLVEVLVGLVSAERPPSFPVRRAVLRQIEDLAMPKDLEEQTVEFARRAFEKPPQPGPVLLGVRSADMRRFVVEQVVLASLVEGRRSLREQAWTRGLAQKLGFDEDAVHAIELEMAEFYASHREVVDAFTLTAGAEVMGEELVDTMAAQLRKNYRRLLKEIKGTGELSVLLTKAARGQALSREERQKMRAQLLEVAKTVPALAIFAAPGGLLMLIALAKVLPPDVLPGWVTDREDDAEAPAVERPRAGLRGKRRPA